MTEKVNFMDQLRKNWAVILFIGGIIMSWANTQNDIKFLQAQIDQNKSEILSLKIKVDSSEKDLSSLSGDIKEIKTSLSFIREQVTKGN